MGSNRTFYVKLGIGISSFGIFLAGIAVKAIYPKEIQPVLGDIDSLMILASGIFGGLVRDVLGFPTAKETAGEPKREAVATQPGAPSSDGNAGS
jgi:hypothetical protein